MSDEIIQVEESEIKVELKALLKKLNYTILSNYYFYSGSKKLIKVSYKNSPPFLIEYKDIMKK